MRTLLLMRGAPGAGKTTWISQHGLEKYAISPDLIRGLCSSTELQPSGKFKISQARENEKVVWNVLMEILEHRMSRGEFTIIDATCSKTKDMQKYKDLAQQYRYRMYVMDFTDIPLSTCLEQNKKRDEEKQVPSKAIENIYSRFATQKVPSGITVIKRDEFDNLLEKPIDLSEYEKIVFVGDIHGCYDTLMQYKDFRDGLNPKYEYIFLGDFLDRGNQNAEVLRWISSIKDLPNVCLLEGNHERHIRDWGNDAQSMSPEFEKNTKHQLEESGIDRKMAREVYRKCRQFSHFTYKGVEVLACHGGIPNLDTNLLFIPSEKLIHGVGEYRDHMEVSESWMSQTKSNQYLVHGHRNTEGIGIDDFDRVFNLEGRVEFGGKLRILELTVEPEKVDLGWTWDYDRDREYIEYGERMKPNWTPVYLDDCQPVNESLNTEDRKIETVDEAISYLRNNRFIVEKQLDDGISSFNFTREAFYMGNWSKQTVLARGLFIDTENKKVIARSYEKFFKIGETRQTELASLKSSLRFPVKAFVKENGFLAIVSYDYRNDDLFIASKSTTKGDYAQYIKNQLEPYKGKILKILRDTYNYSMKEGNGPACSFVFECIDPENDPHIIKYDEGKLVLLDIIRNDLRFDAAPYEKVVECANEIGCPAKELAFELKDWDSFRDLYEQVQDEGYKYNGSYIEGFVFVDQLGFMTKCKTGYYNLWKKLRGVCQSTLRCGHISKTGMLQSTIENLFYGFCRGIYNDYYDRDRKEYPFPVDIISMRERFLQSSSNDVDKLN